MSLLSGSFLLICVFSMIDAKKCYGVTKLPIYDEIIVQAFTPFDKYENVNYDLIPELAQYYKNNKLKVIFVAAFYGAGPSIPLPERKRLVKAWAKQAEIFDFDLIVEVGAMPFVDTLEMARFCSELKVVTAITAMAELAYQATTLEEAVEDLQRICDASDLPLLYYQNVVADQEITAEEVFIGAVEGCVSCFSGAIVSVDTFLNIKASVDSVAGYQLWGWGLDSIAASLKIGMNASVTMDLFPKLAWKIKDAVKNCLLERAENLQQKLNRRMYAITNVNDGVIDASSRSYFEQSKAAFKLLTGIDVGYRYPLECPNGTVLYQIQSNLEELGVHLYSSHYDDKK